METAMDKPSFSLRHPAQRWPAYCLGLSLSGFAAGAWAGNIANTPLVAYPPGGHDFLVILGNASTMTQDFAGGQSRLGAAKTGITELATDASTVAAKTVASGQAVGLGLMTYGGTSTVTPYVFGSNYASIYPSYSYEFTDSTIVTSTVDKYGFESYGKFPACYDGADIADGGTGTGNLQGFFYNNVAPNSHPYCLPRTYLRAYLQATGDCTNTTGTDVCGHVDGNGVLAATSNTGGMGFLQVPIQALPKDSAAATTLAGTFSTRIDSAGTTPAITTNDGSQDGSRTIEGALLTACDYFNTDFYSYDGVKKLSLCYRGYAPGPNLVSDGGTSSPPANQFSDVGQGYTADHMPAACDASVILMTDGVQNTTADGLFYTPDWTAKERNPGNLDPLLYDILFYANPYSYAADPSLTFDLGLTDPVSLALYNLNTGNKSAKIRTFLVGLGIPENDSSSCPNLAEWNFFPPSAVNTNCPRMLLNMLAISGANQTTAQAYYPTDADTLKTALDNIFADKIYTPATADQNLSFPATVTSSTNLQADTLIFQASFQYSYGWFGDLKASTIDGVNLTINAEPEWSASDNMNYKLNGDFDYTTRAIFSYNPNASAGIAFSWAGLNSSQKDALKNGGSAEEAQNLLEWLKGDPSNEGLFSNEGVLYRNRSVGAPAGRILGDIVNSDPAFVGAENFAYDVLPGAAGSNYADFLATKAARPAMVYVGANDGMLHGFKVGTPPDYTSVIDGGDGGREQFAFVPNAVIMPLNPAPPANSQSVSALVNYAALPAGGTYYPHVYTVDGSPSVGDAFLDNGNSVQTAGQGAGWNTVLVGSTGAGAKSIFALDITDPNSFTAGKVMWEISDTDGPNGSACIPACGSTDTGTATSIHGDLGYTLAQPAIVRLNDGHWAAIVANGYNSANGKAILFIFNLADGSLIKKIDTLAAGNTVVALNGLSTPIAVDVDGNRTADTVYAGDLAGNLWKFDISGSDPASWAVAYSSGGQPAPLFVACTANTASCADGDRQPITAKPNVGVANATGQGKGVMVYVGTGKYFELGDNVVPSSPQTQTFYGLYDNNASTIAQRGNLQVQTIDSQVTQTIGSTSFGFRFSTPNEVSYPTQRGWYMDLLTPASVSPSGSLGERVIAFPLLRNGRVIFVTLIPKPANSCESGGESWLMELDALNGKSLGTPPWDLNKDNTFNNSDLVDNKVPSGMKKSDIGTLKTPSVVTVPGGEVKLPIGVMESGSAAPTPSRASWRQLQ